ncbi:MAG: TonB-dependent receptor [Selenomonadaceae bacterium]|nr:TonB-dependent receptor [Selenomonadaceae bacterium]
MSKNFFATRYRRRLSATLAVGTFFIASQTFAADEVSPDENDDAADVNETVRNYLESEDYVITAERIPTNRWDTPATVHIITAEEIERNNYRSVTEALSHVTGVVIQANNAVMLNGNPNVAVLVNGQRLDNDNTYTVGGFRHSVDLLIIPSIKMVERIEIVKGGYSALYGADAVGGVVNIITKKGTRNETTLDFNAGSWRRYNYEITNQGVEGNFSWFATAGLHRSQPYKYRGGTDSGSDYKDNTLSIRLDNRFDERSSLTLNFMHRSHDLDNYARYDFETNRYRFDLYNNISLSYNFKEGTATPGYFRYFQNYKAANNKYDTISEVEEYISEDEFITHKRLTRHDLGSYQKMQGFDYQNGWSFGQHKIIAGFEWHQDKIDSWETTDALYGRTAKDYFGTPYPKMTNRAYYLQDTMTFGDKWTVVAGARLDQNSQFGRHWSPKIAVNYRAHDKTKFYAWWGRFYRIPSWVMLNDGIMGSSKLKAETGHTTNIGVEHNFSDKTSATLNFFNTTRNHALPFGSYSEYVQSGSVKERGVEVSFAQKVDDNFSYTLGYSHTKAVRYTAWHYPQPNGFRAGIQYRNKGLRASLLAVAGSGFDNNFKHVDDAANNAPRRYATLDFNVSYDVTDWATIYLHALNLTNQNYSYGGNSQFYAPGRFVMGGATFRF